LSGAVLGTESAVPDPDGPRGVVTLGFAGDVHFEYHLRGWLGQPAGAFGSMRPALRAPDLMMVNLESSITERGTEEPKEYNFRVSPAALDLLDSAGVDLLTLANNHGADYGGAGLRDTLAAVRTSPVPVIGVGKDVDAAFRPYRTSIRGTDIAVFAASTRNDRTAKAWSAGFGEPGVAVAVTPSPFFLEQVARASRRDHVVVVYLHWGREGRSCPTAGQVRYAQALSAAGADVVLGSHAHVLLGSGWMGDTYVDYGLGNFLWYHPQPRETGILRLTISDGEVVGDSWVPAEQHADGPELLPRAARRDAVADWRRLRRCSGLSAAPSG
jgi:poly-gamma-glutamate synthesis protein (capsule biosynthesis protein)